jgi:hypothetical protein
MKPIRCEFTERVATLEPVLRDTYQAIATFQASREAANQRRVLQQLDNVAPLLAYFRRYVPAAQHGFFIAMAQRRVSVSERIVAFDAVVDALHFDFTVKRPYLHRNSMRLREMLQACREHEDVRPERPATGAPVLVHGLGASPGIGVGEAFVPSSQGGRPSACGFPGGPSW